MRWLVIAQRNGIQEHYGPSSRAVADKKAAALHRVGALAEVVPLHPTSELRPTQWGASKGRTT